jgi:hypothetical protein
MLPPDLISCFIAPLEEEGFEYLVSGSVATSLLGEPRFTADIDIALFLNPAQILLLPTIFPEESYYLPPLDVIQIECKRGIRGHFNIIHHDSGMKADIYPSKNHPYLAWALQRKIRLFKDGITISVAPPEYVIIHKLAFYQEGGHGKHIRDIVAVCRMQQVDMAMISEAALELNLTKSWSEVVVALDQN